jgi:hypothetical protein
VNANDPGPHLRQMLMDGTSYYLLGYTSIDAPRDGRFHEISVRVKRKGIEVRARKGYWAYSPEDVARAARPDRPSLPREMVEALASSTAPASGHAVRTWIGFDRAEVGGQSVVTMIWEGVSDGLRGEPIVRVSVTASTTSGELLFRGKSPAYPVASVASGRVTFTSPPGALHLRVSAEGAAGQVLDKEERDLQVPDFTTAVPIVTIPEIYRARTARELLQIRESRTALPTAIRQFPRTDQLLLRFRAYGPGGTAPAIVVRVKNAQGETISNLPAQERSGGGFEVLFLPSSLAPGTYLMEIEATSGGDTSRTFWGFAVKSQ